MAESGSWIGSIRRTVGPAPLEAGSPGARRPALLSTFEVTSTADDGSTGTLRWAIAQANSATSVNRNRHPAGYRPATIACRARRARTEQHFRIDHDLRWPGEAPVTIVGTIPAGCSISTRSHGITFRSDDHGGATPSIRGLAFGAMPRCRSPTARSATASPSKRPACRITVRRH